MNWLQSISWAAVDWASLAARLDSEMMAADDRIRSTVPSAAYNDHLFHYGHVYRVTRNESWWDLVNYPSEVGSSQTMGLCNKERPRY